ncbi:MAG: prepilin-type N-terminal cleavage/methylation domain-containing protein, partial [Pseudomonadota bacterium]
MINQYCHFIQSNQSNKGISLLELSIVLVILGLVVTGVTKAKDLITSAKLNSQIAQFIKIESALETFKITYGSLPGDISADDAGVYSDISAVIAGASLTTFGSGNNDGRITSTLGANPNRQNGESLVAWRHLKMSAIYLEAPNNNAIAYNTAANSTAMDEIVPIGEFDKSMILFTAYDSSQTNSHRFYDASRTIYKNALTVTALTGTWNNFNTSANAVLTSFDVYNIDKKIDDGHPYAGFVQALDDGKDMSTLLEDPTT